MRPGPVGERQRPVVVGTGDQQPRHLSGERVEGPHVRLRRAEVVQVVCLHIGDDRHLWVVGDEGSVAFVCLGDEDVARAVVRVRAGLVEIAADGERGVGAAVLQGDREHRGRRRLSVRTRDGDRPPIGHDRRQRGGAREHAQCRDVPRRPPGCPPGWPSRRRRCRPCRVGPRACPTYTVAPSARRLVRTLESLASLPDTAMPRASMIRAMPLIPAPPIPTKCTRPSASAGSTRSGGATITTNLH